jgi:uncharacterized membrane protein YkvI
VAAEVMSELSAKIIPLVIIVFIISLPIIILNGKKKHGLALLYLPVWLMALVFSMKTLLGT